MNENVKVEVEVPGKLYCILEAADRLDLIQEILETGVEAVGERIYLADLLEKGSGRAETREASIDIEIDDETYDLLGKVSKKRGQSIDRVVVQAVLTGLEKAKPSNR